MDVLNQQKKKQILGVRIVLGLVKTHSKQEFAYMQEHILLYHQ